jgi:hypothetical protein
MAMGIEYFKFSDGLRTLGLGTYGIVVTVDCFVLCFPQGYPFCEHKRENTLRSRHPVASLDWFQP